MGSLLTDAPTLTETRPMNDVSKLAVLQALGSLGHVEREAHNNIITLLALNSTEPLDPEQQKLGAAPGKFMFRGSPQVYRSSFVALPLFEHILNVEWPPEREKVAPIDHHIALPRGAVPPGKNGEWLLENGNRAVRTRYLYLALANAKSEIDFTDQWALPIYSSGHGFFDREFASQYPMSIMVDGKEHFPAPIACCKWKFTSELHNGKGQGGKGQSWMRVKYNKGSVYGMPHGPTWDELFRGAEIEAEMKRVDELERKQAAPAIEAKPAAQITRGKMTIETGRKPMPAYNPGPPAPPPEGDGKGAMVQATRNQPITATSRKKRTGPTGDQTNRPLFSLTEPTRPKVYPRSQSKPWPGSPQGDGHDRPQGRRQPSQPRRTSGPPLSRRLPRLHARLLGAGGPRPRN
jgi:hypothetical protein